MKDTVMAKDKWEFNAEVANCFSDMITRSIPDYWTMRELIRNLTLQHLNKTVDKKYILDLGCSNGESIRHYVGLPNVSIHGIDNSSEMIEQIRSKYPGNYRQGNICHLCLPKHQFNIIQAILTLQFTPLEYRQEIVNRIYESLYPSGIFIFVEKVLPSTPQIRDSYRDIYHKIKQSHGYTEEQITNKDKALENVLIPLTYEWNIELLKNAGFKTIDCFWKCLNFTGYIAIKD